DQVVGVVSMNPVPPAHPWLDEVSRVFTGQEYADEQAYYQGSNDEPFDYVTSSEQLATTSPTDIPFEMLISTDDQSEGDQTCLKSYGIYEQIMKTVTADWKCGNFSEVRALHDIYRSDPDTVVKTIQRVLTEMGSDSETCKSSTTSG